MLREGVVRGGVATKAKVRPRPDLELVKGPVNREGYKAWRSLNLC